MHVPILQTMKKTHTVARLLALKKVVGRQEMASMSDDVAHPAQPVLPQQSTAAKAADAITKMGKWQQKEDYRWWFQTFFIFNPSWGNDPI